MKYALALLCSLSLGVIECMEENSAIDSAIKNKRVAVRSKRVPAVKRNLDSLNLDFGVFIQEEEAEKVEETAKKNVETTGFVTDNEKKGKLKAKFAIFSKAKKGGTKVKKGRIRLSVANQRSLSLSDLSDLLNSDTNTSDPNNSIGDEAFWASIDRRTEDKRDKMQEKHFDTELSKWDREKCTERRRNMLTQLGSKIKNFQDMTG